MKKTLLKSTLIFSAMTVISRITGLVREMVFAYYFGAGSGMDAFNVAYRIPNFLRGLFGEGAFSQAFIPILSEYKQNRTHDEVRLFLDRVAGAILSVLSILTIVAVLITPWLVYLFAPGFAHDPTRFELTASMLRITFPYILFVSLSAYVSGILNSYGRFGVPAFSPNFLNLALIGSAIFLAPYCDEPTKALAWGIFIGGIAQLAVQLPLLSRLNLLPHPKILWRDEGVRKILKLMIPAILGVSVAQISFLVDNLLASFLPIGSISWLNYSNRLTLFPLGVFGVAIATVVLPHLARKHASLAKQDFSSALDWAIRFVLIIAIPAVIGLSMLAGPIVATLFQFQGGNFTEFDVLMVRKSLFGFVLGVPAFMLIKVLASAFYSQQNIKLPVKIAAISLAINMVLAVILVFPLKHAGLALATSLTSTINAILLFVMLKRKGIYLQDNGWKLFWWRLIFANLVLLLFLYLSSANLSEWFVWDKFTRVLRLALLCVGSTLLYLLSLWITGMRIKQFMIGDE